MRKAAVFVLLGLGLFGTAQAEELKCWDRYASKGALPLLSAQIEADSLLSHIRINAKAGVPNAIKAPSDVVEGSPVDSEKSFYRGNQIFQLHKGRLVLPLYLYNEFLMEALKPGVGFKKGENAALIQTHPRKGHPVLLRCRTFQK